jgi:hypothetical protein
MKRTIYASLFLPFAIFLTSCSSGPSLEDQKKIIAYDNCLEYKIAEMNRMSSSSGTSNKIPLFTYSPEKYDFSHQYQNYREYSDILEECADYLP